ncbi:hypothetical protein GGR57DRAFT_315717 [Xylariaceae sp. FL1272]|nr:hypothetical protein GGR57DRAFT_315717 [Xylariaceae sp. FL1272]
MSSMSRNNSTAALMGFSISQPALGAPLQFFPALGSKELDDLISAYVPGNAHITEKRAAVSMEFFQNAMVTGEYFKFFMVPAFASVAPSPAMDSGYGSSFAASPASQTTSFSSPNMSTPRDYSNVPGMRIMTKDGRDVTNLSSRGCKTKEQRDHAHLMRIIKACDACRKKKVKCDPSHKRPAAGSSGKVTKKASKNSRSAPMSKPAVVVPELKTSETPSSSGSSPSIPLDTVDEGVMDWDQFIKYDDEPLDSIPVDYDFFMDPAGYFSPAGTSATLTSSNTSPSQLPPTPIDDLSGEVHPGTAIMDEESNAPMLPYLSDNGLVSASNYVDFDLFSPPASPFLNEELSMARELSAASPRPNFAGRVIQQSPPPPHGRHRDEYTDDNSRHNPDNAVADSVNIAPGLHLQSTSLSPLAITSYDVSHGGYQDMSTFRHQSPSVQAVSHAMSHGVNAPATGASFNGVQVNSGSYEGVNAIEAQSHPEYQRGVVPLATSSLSDSRNRNTAAASGVTVPREERRSASGLLVAAGANHEAMAPALPGATSFDAFTRFTSSPENAEMIATEPERLSLHQPIVSSNGVLSTSAAQRCTSDDVSRLYERESIYTGTPTRTDTGTAVQHATPQTHVARTIALPSNSLEGIKILFESAFP